MLFTNQTCRTVSQVVWHSLFITNCNLRLNTFFSYLIRTELSIHESRISFISNWIIFRQRIAYVRKIYAKHLTNYFGFVHTVCSENRQFRSKMLHEFKMFDRFCVCLDHQPAKRLKRINEKYPENHNVM